MNEWSPFSMTEAPRAEPASSWASLSFVGEFLSAVTGTGRSQALTLCAFTVAVTGVPIVNKGWDAMEPPALSEFPARPEALARPATSGHSALRELRERTALNVKQLEDLFGVTRATIYSWQKGTSPRGDRESHLLEALAFIRSASEQFPEPQALRQWLMTPIAAGAEPPLNLMAQRRWRPLRGLLVRARTPPVFLSRPEALPGHVPPLSPEQLRQASDQLSPPSALEDLKEAGLDDRQEPTDAE